MLPGKIDQIDALFCNFPIFYNIIEIPQVSNNEYCFNKLFLVFTRVHDK